MGFFKSGFTTADFNSLGKITELIMGAITSIQKGKRFDGRRSDKQADFGDYKIRCLISSTDAG